MKILFLDESGDHNLSKIDPQYPLFVLGGVIVDKEYAEGEMQEAVSDFKQRLFGRNDLTLHTADITRNRNGFERLKDTAFREQFYRELNKLMESLDYRVVACVIRKHAHLSRYGLAAVDPYLLSLDILVERFCMDIGEISKSGMIIAEQRGSGAWSCISTSRRLLSDTSARTGQQEIFLMFPLEAQEPPPHPGTRRVPELCESPLSHHRGRGIERLRPFDAWSCISTFSKVSTSWLG